MHDGQIKTLQRSYRNIALQAEEFTDFFYERLFELDPQIRSRFPADMSELKFKLFQTLGVTINSLGRLDELVPVLQDLGHRHASYGVQSHHYETGGRALVTAVKAVSSEKEVLPEVLDAWRDAYSLISSVMLEAKGGSTAS